VPHETRREEDVGKGMPKKKQDQHPLNLPLAGKIQRDREKGTKTTHQQRKSDKHTRKEFSAGQPFLGPATAAGEPSCGGGRGDCTAMLFTDRRKRPVLEHRNGEPFARQEGGCIPVNDPGGERSEDDDEDLSVGGKKKRTDGWVRWRKCTPPCFTGQGRV